MANPEDLEPVSSYSDPFYDRLDRAYRYLRRRVVLVVIVVVATVTAVLAVNWWLQRNLEAAGLVALRMAELPKPGDAGTDRRLEALADDAEQLPLIRARAAIEVVQKRLDAGEIDQARKAAQLALRLGIESGDTETALVARLSQAAVLFQAGDLEAARSEYETAKRSAAGLYSHQIEAILGLARVHERQGRLEDALTILEPLLSRTDQGSQQLVGLARSRYWLLKARMAGSASAAVPATGAMPIDTGSATTGL